MYIAQLMQTISINLYVCYVCILSPYRTWHKDKTQLTSTEPGVAPQSVNVALRTQRRTARMHLPLSQVPTTHNITVNTRCNRPHICTLELT